MVQEEEEEEEEEEMEEMEGGLEYKMRGKKKKKERVLRGSRLRNNREQDRKFAHAPRSWQTRNQLRLCQPPRVSALSSRL